MDKTKENLMRIKAYDAEEGEWRTIKGARVLVKNGEIVAGAGGKFNGQKFGSKPARSSKVQTMENLASAAKPEKTDPTTSRAVITPEMKKQVEADFEMNKKKFPENEHEAVSQTLKKYFDEAERYLNKDMYNEYAAETAKARCLMKKVYGQEYATRDPAE
jgi:hypothetical protein|nr:MAG TPA: hypothetical protein [Caudoviricetes sp.]